MKYIQLLLNKRCIIKETLKDNIKKLLGNQEEYNKKDDSKLSFFRICYLIALLNQGAK